MLTHPNIHYRSSMFCLLETKRNVEKRYYHTEQNFSIKTRFYTENGDLIKCLTLIIHTNMQPQQLYKFYMWCYYAIHYTTTLYSDKCMIYFAQHQKQCTVIYQEQ